MKKRTKLLLAVLFVLVTVSCAHAQPTATDTSTGIIVTPISIAKTTDMNFGNIAVQASTAGTATLTPASARTSTGSVILPATTGTVTAAAFIVNGQGAYTYAITLTSAALTY